MFARPVMTNVSSYGPPGFVLEVDRYGGTIRTNIEDEFVVATNHFIEYGVNEETDPSSDKYSPWLNFDVPVVSPGSTSWWRHETVLNAVRSKVRVNKMTTDFENAKRILQTFSRTFVPFWVQVFVSDANGPTPHIQFFD